jgi:hypothetical protein
MGMPVQQVLLVHPWQGKKDLIAEQNANKGEYAEIQQGKPCPFAE